MTENEKQLFLEESIFDQKVVTLVMQDQEVKLYPRKISYFDGELHLVGESITDHCLLSYSLSSIAQIYEEDTYWEEIYSLFEVSEFINSLKEVNENSIRLVLKIYSRNNFELNLNSQYYEKPCMITNPKGDYIWAATLEPGPEVFNWLNQLGPSVEILDPMSFKKEFLIHCENKLKKLA